MADYKEIIPFIKGKEGGLSKAKTDTASHYTSPCIHNGVRGWHTNKGIQWVSFKNNANKLGYSASCSNFINMPTPIWEKIYKKIYWDSFYLDGMKHQSIANAVVTWSWGSGFGGAYNSLVDFMNKKYGYSFRKKYARYKAKDLISKLDDLAKRKGERRIFNELNQWRKQFFIRTGQTANIKGWLSRLAAFDIYNQIYLKEKRFLKKYWWAVALGVAGTVGIVLALTKYNKK